MHRISVNLTNIYELIRNITNIFPLKDPTILKMLEYLFCIIIMLKSFLQNGKKKWSNK